MSRPSSSRSRRSAPMSAFSHTPSKLSKSHSSLALAAQDPDQAEDPAESPSSPEPEILPSPEPSRSPRRTGLTRLNGRAPTSASSQTANASAQTSTPGAAVSKAAETPLRRRALDQGVGATPSTPRITYSPYATDNPPPSLSKSASIPFDMAASARAGRQAEQERSIGAEGPGAGGKKRRFVRRKPLLERLTNAPYDIIDKIAFHFPTSFDEILPPNHLANPISLGLHAVLYLLVAPLWTRHDEPDSILRGGRQTTGVGSRWDDLEDSRGWIRRSLSGRTLAAFVVILFTLLAAGNSIYLFTRFRTYDMQLRSAREPIHSPHASPAAKPTPGDGNIMAADAAAKPAKGYIAAVQKGGKITWFLARWTYKTVLSIFGQATSAPVLAPLSGEDRMQSLRVWEPPDFCLAFFCAFPPSAPLLSYLLTAPHPFLTPLLHLIISFLLSHLATSYAQLVKDRMILSAEVMREYDQRFVYKKVFGVRVDRGVQTSQAEQLW